MNLVLGKYAMAVLSAYAITIFLLVVLIVYILRRSAKAKAILHEAELNKDA
jgi:heme exporter protein CcmD